MNLFTFSKRGGEVVIFDWKKYPHRHYDMRWMQDRTHPVRCALKLITHHKWGKFHVKVTKFHKYSSLQFSTVDHISFQMQSHIACLNIKCEITCICLTFHRCVLSNVSSNRLHESMLVAFDFSPLCVFKCVLTVRIFWPPRAVEEGPDVP